MADTAPMFKIIFTVVLSFVLSSTISVQSAPTDLLQEAQKNQSEPIASSSTTGLPETPEADRQEDEDEYDVFMDQRQNGTENYRITLKDVVLIWAPSDAFLAAAALLDPQLLGGGDDLFGGEDLFASEKPQDLQIQVGGGNDKNSSTTVKPTEDKEPAAAINPSTKPVQLRNLQRNSMMIGPFLRRKH